MSEKKKKKKRTQK
jgi:hypothetical protein